MSALDGNTCGKLFKDPQSNYAMLFAEMLKNGYRVHSMTLTDGNYVFFLFERK